MFNAFLGAILADDFVEWWNGDDLALTTVPEDDDEDYPTSDPGYEPADIAQPKTPVYNGESGNDTPPPPADGNNGSNSLWIAAGVAALGVGGILAYRYSR